MLNNEEIKKICEILERYEINEDELKLRQKLELLVRQIEIYEDTQKKIGELQQKIVSLEKSDDNENKEKED